jgi:hypothetical protein
MNTLIDVDRSTSGKVKQFATVRDVSLNKAVEFLLIHALSELGDWRKEDGIIIVMIILCR